METLAEVNEDRMRLEARRAVLDFAYTAADALHEEMFIHGGSTEAGAKRDGLPPNICRKTWEIGYDFAMLTAAKRITERVQEPSP